MIFHIYQFLKFSRNPVLMSYLSQTLDARTLALRLAQFKVNIETDMDRVRETGQCELDEIENSGIPILFSEVQNTKSYSLKAS